MSYSSATEVKVMSYSKKDSHESSSSESSEEEEEQRKIREAVLGVSQFAYSGSASECKTGSCSDTKGASKKEVIKLNLKFSSTNGKTDPDIASLKSNRFQDKNEDDQDQLLKTTPEFRAYVAKQLAKLLDRDLSDCLVERAWDRNLKGSSSYIGGVKLFSDSKGWFALRPKQESLKPSPEPRKRKIRLSTSSSSDSSEDEEIKACVFSVTDIEHENLRLARREKKPTEQILTTSLSHAQPEDDAIHESHLDTNKIGCETSIGKKKKKKRKKKKRSESEGNKIECETSISKKKKKERN